MVNNMKSKIRYARTYKYLSFNKTKALLLLLFFVLPYCCSLFFFFPEMSRQISFFSYDVLIQYFTAENVQIVTRDFFTGSVPLYFLVLDAPLPNIIFTWINLFAAMGLLLIILFICKPKPLPIFFAFALFVHMVSCLFFIFTPETFPYGIAEFSEMYMKQQMGIFICIIFVMGCSTILLPIASWKIISAVIATGIYSLVFSVTRYITFLFFLKSFSVLYMAWMFFTFGPMLDFLYLVIIYSLLANHTSAFLQKKLGVWKW